MDPIQDILPDVGGSDLQPNGVSFLLSSLELMEIAELGWKSRTRTVLLPVSMTLGNCSQNSGTATVTAAAAPRSLTTGLARRPRCSRVPDRTQ